MSLPEVLLWQRLRVSAAGVKFRRQHPVGPYVADFFCREARLAVEVDGRIHDASDRHDRERDRFFETNGLQVLRVSAADVLADPDAVAASIGTLAVRPLHQPAAGPPPRTGEDQE
jgi:very-short-patch-repair endonuclease